MFWELIKQKFELDLHLLIHYWYIWVGIVAIGIAPTLIIGMIALWGKESDKNA